ncbi:hypothetical protein, partial [Thiolapillus sp.]|uniref:hypothetical protein n=1 Tax=Thiolapillus sp. TaxID=2017437 RepID=UPI0025E3F512
MSQNLSRGRRHAWLYTIRPTPKNRIERFLLPLVRLIAKSIEETNFVQDEIDLLERNLLCIEGHPGEETQPVLDVAIAFLGIAQFAV